MDKNTKKNKRIRKSRNALRSNKRSFYFGCIIGNKQDLKQLKRELRFIVMNL